jgi:predicted ATPase
MSKVIGLSGPQGGGKTTLLNGLKGNGIVVDDFKVSRKVQADLGWESLENATSSVATMMMFQEKVRDVKYERDFFNSQRTDVDIVLTERTFADIASYTQLWSWELAHAGKWSVEDAVTFSLKFVDECARFQHVYAGNILLPFMPHIAWQADPNRAAQKDIGFIVEQLDRFFEVKNPKDVPVFRITEGSVQGRIDQVNNWIKTL